MGSGSSPLSYGDFLPPPLSKAFPLLVEHCRSHRLWPGLACLFTVLCGIPLPPLTFRAPHSLCYVSLLFLLIITQFLFFSLGGGRSVQGAMLIWPRVVCWSTVYHLAHLVICVFSSRLGAGMWRWPGALLVSPFNVKWRCSAQAGGVGGQSFASSLWPCLQGVSPASLQDFTLGGMLSASSL
jgi:hypothetical protein